MWLGMSSSNLAALAEALRGVPGIGAASVAMLPAGRPEPGKLDRRRIAARVGWRR
jgi:hypothetical protein